MSRRKKTIESELEQIRKLARGVLRPADVVRFAEDPTTALHSRFDWDDSSAGRKYRLWQARDIIASVTVIPHESNPVEVRAYVSLKNDRGKDSYRATVDVLSDDDKRKDMLADALSELKSFRRKYAALKEVSSVDATIHELRAAMKNATSRKRKAA